MDNYIIELFNGEAIEIQAKDFKNLIGKSGLVFLESVGQAINMAGVKRICSKKTYEIDQLMERQEKQKDGILHDGTVIYKRFSVWYYIAPNGEEYIVERGDYPEIINNCIPTPAEFEQKYRHLTKQQRIDLLSEKIQMLRGSDSPQKRISQGFEKISDSKKFE